MPRKKIEKPTYTGDKTPTVRVSTRHTCHIPRNAKHGRIYLCVCGTKFRFDQEIGLGVEL